LRLGTSAGVQTTSYTSSVGAVVSGNTAAYAATADGIYVSSADASSFITGVVVVTLFGSNAWYGIGTSQRTGGASSLVSSVVGATTLPSTLDRIRLTTFNGTDTFDAGSVNIMYEG
jgi:hypothetical protein